MSPSGYAGGVGNGLLFFSSLIALMACGLLAISYAAHSLLVVLEGTAAGDDDVRWPDEPMYDWLWKPCCLLWMVAFWLVPVWLLVDGVFVGLLGMPPVGLFPAMVTVVWLLFPISLFSALSASSFFIVWRLTVMRRMARRGLTLLWIYLMMGALVVGGAAAAYWAVLSASWLLVVPAALLGSTVLLWYARLLGRLGYLIGEDSRQDDRGRKKRKKRKDPLNLPAPAEEIPVAPTVDAPQAARAFAEAQADEWAPPTAYGLAASPPTVVAAPAPALRFVPQPSDPHGVRVGADPESFDPTALQPQPREDLPAPAAVQSLTEIYESRVVLKPRHPEPPRYPLWTGVFSFPWYETSLGAWFYLALWGAICLTLLRCVLLFWPF